jgi:hypothetical protein
MMATDALMSTDTGVGDEADVMFSGIEPGAGGPRTAGSALEAGQELLGALIPSGPGAETRAAQAEIDAQQEAQNAHLLYHLRTQMNRSAVLFLAPRQLRQLSRVLIKVSPKTKLVRH